MAPRCCSCNSSGRCKSCCCVRRGSPCVDCYIGEERCQNRRLPGATSSSSQPLPGPALPKRNVPTPSSPPVTGSKADFPPRPAKTSVDSSSSRPPLSQQTRNPLPSTTPASHLSRNDSRTMEGGATQSVSTTAPGATVPAASDPDGSPGTNRVDRGVSAASSSGVLPTIDLDSKLAEVYGEPLQGPVIFQNGLSPYQRVWPSFLYSTASMVQTSKTDHFGCAQ